MKIDSNSFERVEEFKYLGTTLTNQNFIQEAIKSRLKSGNAGCHSMQNLLCSRLLSKNLKIKIYRTIIFPVVLYGCETCLKIWEPQPPGTLTACNGIALPSPICETKGHSVTVLSVVG
jgi:hypothetical protein